MKKIVLIVLGLIIIGGIAFGGYYFYKKKSHTKTVTQVHYKSTTMPEIYHEIVEKSDPFSLYGRNNEMVPILQKKYEQDSTNMQLKFTLGLQNIYNGTTQRGIDLL